MRYLQLPRSLGAKLVLIAGAVIVTGLGALAVVMSVVASKKLDDANYHELGSELHQVVDMIAVLDASLKAQASRLNQLFAGHYPGAAVLDRSKTARSGDVEAPVLTIGGTAVNGQTDAVDRFAAATGGNATVFVRRGDDFVRVATSLKKENGDRAVGTTLDRNSPAYAAAIRGEPYAGPMKLFGRDVMSQYRPIRSAGGDVVGIWFVGLDFTDVLAELKKRILSLKIQDTGYFYALDARPGPSYGHVAIHPTRQGESLLDLKDDANGHPFIREILERKNGQVEYSYLDKKRGDTVPQKKIARFAEYPEWQWVIVGGSFTSEFEADRMELLKIIVGGSVAVTVVLLLLLYFAVRRMVSAPMTRAVKVAESVASGDLAVQIDVNSRDEVGQLLLAMKTMMDRLRGVVMRIRESSESVSTAAQEIAAGNADLSQRTEEQASSLEETASSMEELTGTVKQNAENAKQANQLAAAASAVAVQGGQVVGDVVDTMNSITESSKKIADIIGVIDGIAFQTNILALNAAVEAARAGEQGRGFAVVASEVRSLAQRSAAAAKEIKQLIGDSVNKVDTGSKLVEAAGKTMDDIVTSVKRVTDIMAEITAASQEQSAGIEQVSQAVLQMDKVTQQNAALVEEAAAAAESMQEQAKELNAAVSVFRIQQESVVDQPTLSEARAAKAKRLTEPARKGAEAVSCDAMDEPLAAAAGDD